MVNLPSTRYFPFPGHTPENRCLLNSNINLGFIKYKKFQERTTEIDLYYYYSLAVVRNGKLVSE